MLVFNERTYGERLCKYGYQTYKNQGRERCILVRYLRNIGKDDNYIIKKLNEMPFVGKEYLNKDDLNIIFQKILDKASQFEYMSDISVLIYKSEMDVVLNVSDENARNLLFVLLVYYKWACFGKHLYFDSKKNGKKWVLENDNDIFKLADLFKFRKNKRYESFRYLVEHNLYVSDIIGSSGMFYLPFVQYDSEIAFEINNYDDVLGWLYYYLGDYKLCENCGIPIQKTLNKQRKYCQECARNLTKENKRKYWKNKVSGQN